MELAFTGVKSVLLRQVCPTTVAIRCNAMSTPASVEASLEFAQAASNSDADEHIREGYPFSVAATLQEALGLTDAQMAEVLGRSRRRFAQFKREAKRLGLA